MTGRRAFDLGGERETTVFCLDRSPRKPGSVQRSAGVFFKGMEQLVVQVGIYQSNRF